MKNLMRVVVSGFSACLFLSLAAITNAAEIKVLNAHGFREVMKDVTPNFEQTSGHKLAIIIGTLGAIMKLINSGETADIVIIPRQGIDSLVKDGKVAAGDVAVVARTSLSVAVRKGAPKPDISSPEAFKRTLLAAKSITYTEPEGGAASGIYIAKMLERMGIASEIKSKTVFANSADMGVLLASGKAEIALQQFQNLILVSGIDIVGPFPGALQETTVYAVAILANAKNADAAKALLAFLRTPESTKIIKATGFEPG